MLIHAARGERRRGPGHSLVLSNIFTPRIASPESTLTPPPVCADLSGHPARQDLEVGRVSRDQTRSPSLCHIVLTPGQAPARLLRRQMHQAEPRGLGAGGWGCSERQLPVCTHPPWRPATKERKPFPRIPFPLSSARDAGTALLLL